MLGIHYPVRGPNIVSVTLDSCWCPIHRVGDPVIVLVIPLSCWWPYHHVGGAIIVLGCQSSFVGPTSGMMGLPT